MTVLLQAVELTRIHRLGSGHQVTALEGVSYRFVAGNWYTVTGPSGSGKSSLLSLLATLDRPTSGRVLLEGADLSFARDTVQAWYRKKRAGIVFQEYQLVERMTAWENVALPMVVTAASRSQRYRRALELLDRVALADRAEHLPCQLSGGERQRVALARALIHEPDILFADEPTSNIDRQAAARVEDFFRELRAQGRLLIVVSHESALVKAADQVLELRQGRLVA